MKRYFLLVCFTLFVISCKQNTSKVNKINESDTNLTMESTAIENKVSEKNDSVSIEKASVTDQDKGVDTIGTNQNQCQLSLDDVKKYDKLIRSIYINDPEKLKEELHLNALEFTENFYELLKSNYESEFNVETFYEVDADSCGGSIHYHIQDQIEEEGEIYNVEFSTMLIIKLIGAKLVIVDIGVAG
ncbi:hypothetical protein [Aquimarina sp. SS2-1]|uniref:hypothetical protein n=1 Tax=Aquimarina besae TaxID=3342247 RepID=UPI00366C4E25